MFFDDTETFRYLEINYRVIIDKFLDEFKDKHLEEP